MTGTTEPDQVHFVSGKDARAVLDEAARHYLQISGEEFLRNLRAGRYGSEDSCADPRILYLTMLAPFGDAE